MGTFNRSVSSEAVVKAVMEFVGHEDAPSKPKAKQLYKCPKAECGRVIKFPAKF